MHGGSRHHHQRSSSQWLPPGAPFTRFPLQAIRNKPPEPIVEEREVLCNASQNCHRYELPSFLHFPNNRIHTTKYNAITFLPKNLFEQFHRLANIYFVMIICLNWIPALQAFSKYLGIVPVVLILSLTAIKDLIEDLRRRILDNKINGSLCHVWDKDKRAFRRMQWQYVLVGDVVHAVPADILLIRSSDPHGVAFVETANLDGETSLKQRCCPKSFLHYSTQPEIVPNEFDWRVHCEKPQKQLYNVNGYIDMGDGRKENLQKEHLVLRGSTLRNTTWVEGIVLYTGYHTKVMLNNLPAPAKRSSIERVTNMFILGCVVLLVAMCLIGAIGSMLWLTSYDNRHIIPFIPGDTPQPGVYAITNFGAFIINYQVSLNKFDHASQILIPLSLYITVEVIKLGQILLLNMDEQLYHEGTDERVGCRSLTIPEELGQIGFVLSDKTGTITENVMIFRNVGFDGADFACPTSPQDSSDDARPNPSLLALAGHAPRESSLHHLLVNMAICNTVVVNHRVQKDAIEVGYWADGVYSVGNSDFYDVDHEAFERKIEALNAPPSPLNSASNINELASGDSSPVLELAITVEEGLSISQLPSPVSSPTSPVSPTSPFSEEGSLSRVSSISRTISDTYRNIKFIGYKLRPSRSTKKSSKGVHKSATSQSRFEAESPDEKALVFGARAHGYTLLDRNAHHVQIALPSGLVQNYEILKMLPFDSQRKRMSVVVRDEDTNKIFVYTKGADSAMLKCLSNDVTKTPAGEKLLRETETLINEYATRGLRTLVFGFRELAEEEMEEWLEVHEFAEAAASDSRDELLAESASRIECEMLLLGVTGIEDRLQEGVESTISALRAAGVQVWILTGDKLETAVNIARACGLFPVDRTIVAISNEDDIAAAKAGNFTEGSCLLLCSEAIALLRGSPDLVDILSKSSSVLCYRMTPAEKAEVVKTVKTCMKGKVLAIGDGANDVPMIQSAHVGIGVSGREGMQAVMVSDFSISRFHFLTRLLLVHGHWNYARLAKSFLYFLYKNASLVFVIFFAQFFNGYSGQSSMDAIYMMLYPIIFTSVQPLLFGIADQNAEDELLLGYPKLYAVGRLGQLYNVWLFILNIVDAIWQGAVIYFIAHLTYWDRALTLWEFGFEQATALFLVNCTHLALEVRCWTKPMIFVFAFFLCVHFGFFFLYQMIITPAMQLRDTPIGVARAMCSSWTFWLALPLTVTIALFPRMVVRVLVSSFFPSLVDVTVLKHRSKTMTSSSY